MILHTIYIQSLKTIIAIMILMLIVWPMISVILKRYIKFWRILNSILAFLSMAVILYTTIIHRSADTNETFPFIRTIEHIKAQPELVREMVMNVFLFFPFGLTLPNALENLLCRDDEKSKAMLSTILTALILSACIEFIQYLLNIGNAELSDIIMNTIGAAVGSVSYNLSSKLSKMR